MRREPRRNSESGFALLFVFALAAAAALMLYTELPRVAFQSQREKEELLIARGEQYARAIQLYIRKFNKYPASLDDLEKTNNIRFLRRRYKDPMTGKQEWRLIHAGPGGVLTDSLTQKQPGQQEDKEKEKEGGQSATTTGTGNPFYAAAGQPGLPVQPGLRRRPSETGGAFSIAGGMASGTDVEPGQLPADQQPPAYQAGSPVPIAGQPYVYQQPQGPYPYPQTQPGQQAPGYPQPPAGQPAWFLHRPLGQQPQQVPYPASQPQAYPQQPGQPPTGYPPSPAGQPPYPVQPGQSPYPTQNIPGLPGPYGASPGAVVVYPGAPASSQTGGAPPQPYPAPQPYPTVQPYPASQPYPGQSQPVPAYSTQPGVGGAPVPGQSAYPQPGYQPAQTGPAGQNPALGLIQKLLTTPRASGLTGAMAGGPGGGQIMGGGIAGVASTFEAEGIKVYNERTKYNEWEFLYDPAKDRARMGQFGVAPGLNQPGKTPSTSPSSSPSQPLFTPIQPGGRTR